MFDKDWFNKIGGKFAQPHMKCHIVIQSAGVLGRLARRIHLLAGQGTNARTPTARSELYGEMLGLCAECHTPLGRGPGQ